MWIREEDLDLIERALKEALVLAYTLPRANLVLLQKQTEMVEALNAGLDAYTSTVQAAIAADTYDTAVERLLRGKLYDE